MRDGLHSEDVQHGLNDVFRIKPFQIELKLFFLEQLVVEKVVDEVEEELGLRFDLCRVFFGTPLLLFAES